SITHPSDNHAVWEKFAAFVLRATRGHAVTDADSSRHSLTIDSPRMRGDTIVYSFTRGGSWRCPNSWPGSGSMYELRLVLFPFSREHLRALPVVEVGHYDSLPGCRR